MFEFNPENNSEIMQELPGLSRTVTMMSQCGTDGPTNRQTDGVQKLPELLFATKNDNMTALLTFLN